MTLRIGSLFSGYGGLDMGVQDALGGEVVWHCQYDPEDPFQYAARILAHNAPGVPNLGNINRVRWAQVLEDHGHVDVVTGGFPCVDLSTLGRRLGLIIGNRSGLWHRMLEAILNLQPRLVVIENVRGILSAKARGYVDPCTSCVEYAGNEPVLRALGAVLGDLASIGFDAEWGGIRAAEVDAPHERFREIILAWPAGQTASLPRPLADTPDLGHERGGPARLGGNGPADGVDSAAHPDGGRRDADQRDVPEGEPHVAWGDYSAAIRRWERTLGRRHPRPVDDRGQLTPAFSEWMMGLPEGHVSAVPPAPGMSPAGLRRARLKALGNGVVPRQASAGVRLLLQRVAEDSGAAA